MLRDSPLVIGVAALGWLGCLGMAVWYGITLSKGERIIPPVKPLVEEEEEEEEGEEGTELPLIPTVSDIEAAELELLEEDEEDSEVVPEGEALKMVCCVRKDLNMSKGKIAAQVAHSVLGVFKIASKLSLPRHWIKAWSARGCAKITLRVEDEAELFAVAAAARSAGIPSIIIEDAGRTEVAAGTKTVCAIGPAPVALIDTITGKRGSHPLRLLE